MIERQHLEVLSDLMIALTLHIRRQGWTQRVAAQHLGVSQPRISDLTRGNIELFSIDSVVRMLAAAGLNVETRIKARPKA